MKRIKAMNGYTIYELTARDEKNGDGIEGEYAVYFSSDIREYGRAYSYPQWDGIDSLQEAEWLCTDRENVTYARARELCEAESTCVSFEDIEEKIEELNQRGIDATAYETTDELEEAMTETMNTYRVSFETKGGVYCSNIAKAGCIADVEEYYSAKARSVICIEQATDADIREAERKGMPIITIEAIDDINAQEESIMTESAQAYTASENQEDINMTTQAQEKQDTRTKSQRIVDDIAETLRAIVDGEYYGDDYDAEDVEEEDREPLSMWEYFDGDGIYNIDYVCDSYKEYKAVRIMVACGGPNIYINTWDRCVELYWWGSDAKAWLTSDICDAIDEVFEEIWNCM